MVLFGIEIRRGGATSMVGCSTGANVHGGDVIGDVGGELLLWCSPSRSGEIECSRDDGELGVQDKS